MARPRYSASIACAASSTTGCPSESRRSRSLGWPARSTGRIAFVREVTAFSTWAGSILRSSSRTSTNTGHAPAWTTTFAVAGQVIGEVITSSPGAMPSATSARCIAAVPDESAIACRAPVSSASRRSSSAARGPLVSHPLVSVSVTAAISSGPIAGGWKERKVLRLAVRVVTLPGAWRAKSKQAQDVRSPRIGQYAGD